MEHSAKIQAIKEVRSRTSLGLLDAKNAIESYDRAFPRAIFSELVDWVVAHAPPPIVPELDVLRAQLEELIADRDSLWTCASCGAMFPAKRTDEPNGRCSQCVRVDILTTALQRIAAGGSGEVVDIARAALGLCAP